MAIVESVSFGIVAALLAVFLLRSSHPKLSATVAVGILGALIGLAIDVAMGYEGVVDFISGERLASICGAVSALFLWFVALRLFLDPAPRIVHE